MTTDSEAWESGLWQTINAAAPGLPTLHATLAAARSVCDAAMPQAGRGEPFDPATGWAHLDGVMAGLELATGLAARSELTWPPPISAAAAAKTLDLLLRRAADITLELGQQLHAGGSLAELRSVAAVARQLPTTYEATLGQPW